MDIIHIPGYIKYTEKYICKCIYIHENINTIRCYHVSGAQ